MLDDVTLAQLEGNYLNKLEKLSLKFYVCGCNKIILCSHLWWLNWYIFNLIFVFSELPRVHESFIIIKNYSWLLCGILLWTVKFNDCDARDLSRLFDFTMLFSCNQLNAIEILFK